MTKPPRLAKKDLSPVNRATDDHAGAGSYEATLQHADRQQTNRSGADRTDADMNEANLGGASLRDATATGATLKGADLGESNRVTAEPARDAAGAWHRGRPDPSASRERVLAAPSSAEAAAVLVWEGEGGRCEPSND
jgi:uncharacterized protein YjbI with pentapeptide repeats